MSTLIPSNDTSMVEQVIKGLLLPDNTLRKEAEVKLQSLLAQKEPLCICLTHLLTTSQDPLVQSYAAVITRKLFIVKDDEISSAIWKSFSNDSKTQIKTNLLSALTSQNTPQIKKKIINCVVNVFTCLTENEEKWPELLQYVVNGFKMELNETNLNIIELCLSILSSIYQIGFDELKDGVSLYCSRFEMYFKSNAISLKAKTVQCISEFLCSSMSKKESKQFRGFIFYMLETTYQCLNANDSVNLRLCLESLNDLCNCEPKILRKSFSDLFVLMGKIIENKNTEDSLREIAFELLITLIEATPKVIEKDTDKLNQLIQALFKYAMEIDSTIDEEWLRPSMENYIADEFIPEDKLDTATSQLIRLFEVINEKTILPIVSNNISELLQHAGSDWKYKYIAYITIAEIVEFIPEMNSITSLIEMILNDLNNENVKIQYACLYCIAELAEGQSTEFQNEYHARIIPALFALLKQTNVLRIQIQICDALDCFIEHVTDQQASQYIQSGLDVLFGLFIKDDNECPMSLKEGILNVVNQFIDASSDEFKKYADKALSLLLSYLEKVLKDSKGKTIIGVLLETISTVGPLCQDTFKTCLPNVINVLTQIHLSLNSYKDNIGNYLYSAWEKVMPLLLENHKEQIPQILESLITLLKKPPEMAVSSQPEEKIDVVQFFKEDEENEKDSKKVTLTTSETEEFTTFIEILNLILESAPEYAVPYIQIIYDEAIKLLAYPNEDIQSEIANTFALLIPALQKGDVNTLHATAKKYIADLVLQLEKEKSFTTIVQMLNSVKDIIDKVKLFLVTPEINDLTYKLLGVFDRVEKARISLMKQKDETEKEVEEGKKRGDNKIYSDDEDDGSDEEILDDIKDQIEELEEVQTSFNDFFGTLFNTHKELTLEVVDKLLKEYLPKYFDAKASNFEKKLGLFIIDDMAEYLEQKLLNNIWTDIAKILITYVDHSDYELRNSACFGIGVFAQHTTNDFGFYANDLLNALAKGMVFPEDVPKAEKDDMKFAKDNAVSALGKIIKYHGKEIELNKWIGVWLKGLPIERDSEEGKIMNEFVMEILEQTPTLILGENNENLQHIIVVLAKAYDTDFAKEETSKKIKTFVNGVKANSAMMEVVKSYVNSAKAGKTLNKVKNLFKD